MTPWPKSRAGAVASLACSVLVALALGWSTVRAQAAGTGLFHTRELYSADLAAFTKWDGVVARTDREERHAATCPAGAGKDCVALWWQRFVATLSRLPLRARVERVNAVLNQVRYVSAETNWHDPNHWETPYEFLTHGGQCQDYAIAKYMALEASGVPDSALRLAVVHDRVTALDHAVAVVYVDGQALVLDNQTAAVMPADQLRRYVPYYSINRSGWWYHVPAQGTGFRVASSR